MAESGKLSTKEREEDERRRLRVEGWEKGRGAEGRDVIGAGAGNRERKGKETKVVHQVGDLDSNDERQRQRALFSFHLEYCFSHEIVDPHLFLAGQLGGIDVGSSNIPTGAAAPAPKAEAANYLGLGFASAFLVGGGAGIGAVWLSFGIFFPPTSIPFFVCFSLLAHSTYTA
jgi:hypothetical protein